MALDFATVVRLRKQNWSSVADMRHRVVSVNSVAKDCSHLHGRNLTLWNQLQKHASLFMAES